MKSRRCLLLLFQLLCNICLAQNDSETFMREFKSGYYYPDVIEFVERQTDIVTLNSVIEVNGMLHPRDTYGYIDYCNSEGAPKRCFFLHFNGIITISRKEYDEILKLSDTSQVEIAICLQSPEWGDWGECWDKVLVKGSFDVSQLATTRNMMSPCLHFIITSIGKKVFKIQFYSWKVQTCYYSVDSYPLTSKQRRRLDRKERKIYERANLLSFERKIW